MRPQTPRPGAFLPGMFGSLGGSKKMVGLTRAWGFAGPTQRVYGERRPWSGQLQLVGRDGGEGCGEKVGRGRDCGLGLGLMNRYGERNLGSKRRMSEFKIPKGESF